METEETRLEANEGNDENFTETEETTEETELETQPDDDVITLTKAELEERERAIRKEQDKRWKDRLKGQKGDEQAQGDSETQGVATKEEMDRFRLETKGIVDKASQDFILKYAKLEELSVTDALKDEVVQAKLTKMNADVERERATGSPLNRTMRPREKTPEELARLAETGKISNSKEERKKALAALQAKYGRT